MTLFKMQKWSSLGVGLTGIVYFLVFCLFLLSHLPTVKFFLYNLKEFFFIWYVLIDFHVNLRMSKFMVVRCYLFSVYREKKLMMMIFTMFFLH